MTSSETEYRLEWLIENYSLFKSFSLWLLSPKFTIEGLERTSWNLGMDSEFLADPGSKGHSVWLDRSGDDEGPESIGIKFEITITTVKGCSLYSSEHTFGKGTSRNLAHMGDEVCVPRDTDLPPPDTVVVHCRMWRGEGNAEKVTQCTARTRAAIRKVSFLLKAENFSAFQVGRENTFRKFPSLSKTGCGVSAFLKKGKRGEESIIVDIDSLDKGFRIHRKTLFLIDASGNTVEVDNGGDFDDSDSEDDDSDSEAGDGDLKEDDHREENLPKLTKQFILSNKDYLPNDELTLMCELIVWREDCISDETLHDIPMGIYRDKYRDAHFWNPNNVAEQSDHSIAPDDKKVVESSDLQSKEVSDVRRNSADNIAVPVVESNQIGVTVQEGAHTDVGKLPSYPSVTDDLAALYREQLLTDVELKTATKSFPAHKLVLCVKSSVFSSILSDNTRSIKVDDMEDETVNKFLLFLYTDTLEDLRWESAIQLYRAGGEYDVETLKELCSIFLVDNLRTSNASELLLLAETQGDAKLKESVSRYILEHEEEVFGSAEWRNLSKTNLPLSVETMLLKYERKE